MSILKTRRFYGCPCSGQTRSSIFVPLDPYSNNGTQSVESRWSINHARLAGGRWSGGGPFILTRDTTTWSPEDYRITKLAGGGQILTQGTARIEQPTSSIPDLTGYVHPSDSQLFADGTTAIARVEPTNPAFDLSTFIGELRAEGLPNLPGTAMMETTRKAKAAGSEYLNVEFGWSPLVRGVRDFAKTVDNSDKILRKYQEGSNRVLSRRYDWPEQRDARADACTHSMYPAVSFFTGGGRHQSILQNKWFEADFIYHLPTGGSINDKMRRYGSYARKLLGIDLSPEVLWNLSPWSWAADWFGNVGDIMHNISALGTDGLVMRNAYIMCHTRKVTVDSGVCNLNGRTQVKTRVQESKTRLGATPYGFGVSYSSLSVRQKAVVAALALSKW